MGETMKSKSIKIERNTIEISPYARLVSMPIHSENIFHFPEGIPAFESSKEFLFLFKPDTNPFLFMHALEPADLAFVCIDPFLICPDYQPKISEADINFLHLKKPEDLLILTLVTVASDMRETTTNLQGPIVINMQASLGKQIICDGQHYPVRYKIWDAINKVAREQKNKNAQLLTAV